MRVAAGMRFFLRDHFILNSRMRGPGCWIVVTLLLCVFIGSVSADGLRGGMSSYADPESSGGISIDDSDRDDTASPGNHRGSVNSDRVAANSAPPATTSEGGAPGDVTDGQNFPSLNHGEEGAQSRSPGGAENNLFQGSGERSNSVQETESPHGSGARSQNVKGDAGLSGSVLGYFSPALKEDGPETGQHGGRGSMGVMVASMGSAGLARSGLESPGGVTARGDADRDALPQRQQRGPPEQATTNYPCGPADTTPVTPAQGQGQTDTREQNTSRSKSKRHKDLSGETNPGDSAPTAPSPPRIPLFPYSLLLFGGYRRISKKNVLLQDARSLLYRAITHTPGVDAPTLAAITGLNENTIRYHLVKLIANGKVTYLVKPGVIRYFLNQGAYSPYEQVFIHYLWSETPREIILLLRRTPGLTRQQISDSLGISGPSVTRQMDHMGEDRVIENRYPGRSNHYYLTNEAMTVVERMISRTSGAVGSKDSRLPLPALFDEVAAEPPVVQQ